MVQKKPFVQMFASLPLQRPHLLQQKIANNYIKVKKILEVHVQIYDFGANIY